MAYRNTMDYYEKQNENSFEQFSNSMLAGAVKTLFNSDLTIVWANDYFFEMLGYTRKEYLEIHENKLAPIIYKEDYFMLMVGASRWYYETNRNIMNIRYVHKSGKIVWVKNSSLMADEYINDQQVLYNVITDVTILKEYELTLTKQAGFLKSLIEGSLVGLVQFQEGKRPKILYSNDMAFLLLGYTKEEFQSIHGNYFYSIIHKDDVDYVTGIQSELTLNGNTMQYEFRAVKRDGEVTWLLANGRRCINQSGISVYQCEFIDITDRKKKEYEIKKELEDQKDFMNSLPIGIGRVKFEDKPELIYANEELKTILALQKTEKEGTIGLEKLINQNEMIDFMDLIKQNEKQKKAFNCNISMTRQDGKEILVHIKASWSSNTNENKQLLLSVTPISE